MAYTELEGQCSERFQAQMVRPEGGSGGGVALRARKGQTLWGRKRKKGERRVRGRGGGAGREEQTFSEDNRG